MKTRELRQLTDQEEQGDQNNRSLDRCSHLTVFIFNGKCETRQFSQRGRPKRCQHENKEKMADTEKGNVEGGRFSQLYQFF